MLTLRIAARYICAPKSHKTVNVIAAVAVTGVTVAVAAMVIVLSVYNGFAGLAEKHLSRLDAPLAVQRADGRVVADADSLGSVLKTLPGVGVVAPTLTRRALMVRDNTQAAVMFKAVPDVYAALGNIDSMIIDGTYARTSQNGVPAAQISVGVANAMLQAPDAGQVLQLYVPRRVGSISPANPAAAFRTENIVVSGVFRVGQNDVDNDMVIIPIDVARSLLDYDTEADAVEIYPDRGADPDALRHAAVKLLGDGYTVRTRLEQRTEAFRMISVEKWVTFMMLIFVMAIALFNIFATLSLLVIEKRNDMSTLRALGATRRTVRRIFFDQGVIITVAGGVAGIVIGIALSLVQQYGHFISLGSDPSQVTVEWYPVEVLPLDIVIVAAAVAVAALLSGTVASVMARHSLNKYSLS